MPRNFSNHHRTVSPRDVRARNDRQSVGSTIPNHIPMGAYFKAHVAPLLQVVAPTVAGLCWKLEVDKQEAKSEREKFHNNMDAMHDKMDAMHDRMDAMQKHLLHQMSLDKKELHDLLRPVLVEVGVLTRLSNLKS
jgi:hypothetical protein